MAGPVGFEPTTFGSPRFAPGAGARCPVLVVLADLLLGDLDYGPVLNLGFWIE